MNYILSVIDRKTSDKFTQEAATFSFNGLSQLIYLSVSH